MVTSVLKTSATHKLRFFKNTKHLSKSSPYKPTSYLHWNSKGVDANRKQDPKLTELLFGERLRVTSIQTKMNTRIEFYSHTGTDTAGMVKDKEIVLRLLDISGRNEPYHPRWRHNHAY